MAVRAHVARWLRSPAGAWPSSAVASWLRNGGGHIAGLSSYRPIGVKPAWREAAPGRRRACGQHGVGRARRAHARRGRESLARRRRLLCMWARRQQPMLYMNERLLWHMLAPEINRRNPAIPWQA